MVSKTIVRQLLGCSNVLLRNLCRFSIENSQHTPHPLSSYLDLELELVIELFTLDLGYICVCHTYKLMPSVCYSKIRYIIGVIGVIIGATRIMF